MLKIALASIRSRLAISIMISLSICASMVLLLSVDRIKQAAENGFSESISGVDLLVGPRGGELDLVLYSVFHVGQPSRNVTTQTAREIRDLKGIDWVVPIALGDSHNGYPVTATTPEYFDKITFRNDQPLSFSQGKGFEQFNEVVIGSRVAQDLGYKLGQEVFLSHGNSSGFGKAHDDFSFTISGILEPTGTPIDKVLLIDLKGFELIHLGWNNGQRLMSLTPENIQTIPKEKLEPESVTALYVGVQSPLHLFKLKRQIDEYENEALSAVLPGIALSKLWDLMSTAENSLIVLSGLVLLISIISMITTTLAMLESRKREMTILRSLGATPLDLSKLIIIESTIMSLAASVLAIVLVEIVSKVTAEYLSVTFGFTASNQWLSIKEIGLLGLIVLAGLISSLWPAIRVYRQQISKGLT